MSVDYSIIVKRKKDNKKIAEFNCNCIKSLMDSKYNHVIHCDGGSFLSNNHKTFTVNELSNMIDLIFQEIKNSFNNITTNKLMICAAKSKDVADKYADDNIYKQEYIEDDLRWQYEACCKLLGKIECVTEDLYKKNKPAYQYNAEGLDDNDCIWCEDVYCEIDASY